MIRSVRRTAIVLVFAGTAALATVPARAAVHRSASISLRGAVVVIDPGHNGANASHPTQINRQVWIGNGWKACNTVGTETNAGYPEHAFTFDVAQRTASKLRALGARVFLTRLDDAGWGPCIDRRAALANYTRAAAAVSIHADGGPAGGQGFFVVEPGLVAGLNAANVAPSAALGQSVHDAMVRLSGFGESTYAGRHGVMVSTTYGGLNLAKVPAVLVETVNMRNARDAARIVHAAWRDRIATALASGIARFLQR